MSGGELAAATKAAVLQAMMNDLGNHRIEELVHDSHQQPAPSFNTLSVPKPTQPRNGRVHHDSPAQGWITAVADGFNDDDAAGVSGLDPLDNGNAHRLSSGHSGSDKNRAFDTTRVFEKPKYDPSQPTYRRGTPKGYPNMDRSPNGMIRHTNTPNGNPRVSALGGIVPDGGEVRRWDSGRRLNVANQIHNPILNLPAGRGRPVPGQAGPPSIQPAQTANGHGRGGRLPNPLQMNGTSRDAPTQQPQDMVGRDRGTSTQPQRLQLETSRATAKTPKTSPRPSEALWVPPHLRVTSGGRSPPSTVSQSPISQQTSLRPNDKTPSLDAREIFLQEDVLVLPQCGTKKPARGKIVVYELLDTPIGIWELIIEEEHKVTRGDVRELLEVLSDGSKAFLRRVHSGRVVSDPLRFPTVDEARAFMNEVNLRRGQFSSSSEATYTESTMEWPVQDKVACKTTDELTENATHETAIESTQTSQQRDNGLSFNSLQSMQTEPSSKAGRPARLVTELDQQRVEPPPHTPSISSPTANTTMTNGAANGHARAESNGSDGNLISFSPEKHDEASRSDPLHGIPINYSGLKRMYSLLGHTFENPHPMHSDPAYIASFLHLLEREEFMAQSPDDRKKCIEALYNKISGKNARIILSPEVLHTLRSNKVACPEAIEEFNTFIRGRNSEIPREPRAPREPTHTSRPTSSDGPNEGDSSNQQLPSGATTIVSQLAPDDVAPSKPSPSEPSSQMSDRPSRGLMSSRWARDELDYTEQQSTIRGENIPTYNPLALSSLEDTENKPEQIVDREASGHRRSSTSDTMSNLADQLGLLRM
ncbi:hypothetical protein F4679DRAFT_584000 [Xylaria curta]|nr:hypothetical protein F4679DRAFT_584000 [Xylaria curta]